MAKTDVIELLMSGESEQRCRDARSWTALMRLLMDDARSSEAGRVAVSLEQASSAFDRHVTEEIRAQLVELLRVFLRATLRGTGRGGWFYPRGGEGVPESCWASLQQYRAERPWLAGVPAPNESAISVAERLLKSLEDLVPIGEEGRGEVEVWRARWWFAAGEPERAHRHLEEQLTTMEGAGDRIMLVARLAELQLERGAVLRSVTTLEEHQELSLVDEGLLELRALTAMLLGRRGEAASIRALLGRDSRDLPPAVLELRERVPEWAELLPGQPALTDWVPAELSSESLESPVQERVAEESVAMGRGELGAAFLAVFQPVAGERPLHLHSEVSPGWRRRLEPWLSSRDGLCDSLERLEQELVATARPVIRHRTGSVELRGLLGAESSLSLALCPILDPYGEVSAWLHLEFEHHLVPSVRCLEALAVAWREELRGQLPDSGKGSLDGADHGGAKAVALCSQASPDDPRARFFRQFATELGMKTARRRWWGFAAGETDWVAMASGGGALTDSENRPGGARCLSRIQRCGVPIRFDAPDPALSLHADAASGLVLPLRISGRTIGCFIVESERRRDFRGEDWRRFNELGVQFSARLQVARFRAWHFARFGVDLFFDVESEGFGRRALDFALAGRVNGPIVLSGPSGAGKEVLARWLHFERAAGVGEVEVLRCGATPDEELEERLRVAAVELTVAGVRAPKTLVIKDLVDLSPRGQAHLLRLLDIEQDELRVIVTLPSSLEEVASKGSLSRVLASRLCRLEFFVPPLSDRRGEIVGIIHLLTARFASEFGVTAPTWKDRALALLWRQPWMGNVRELEGMLYKLVLLHPGKELDVEDVGRVARRFRVSIKKRLPSRHPRLEDLLTAVRITRKQSGNANKTRAALYLGWDPDTLMARLSDAGVDPQTLQVGSSQGEAASEQPEDGAT